MALNLATTFIVSAMTLSASIAGGYFAAGQVSGKTSGAGTAVQIASIDRHKLWVMTPAFSLADTKGGQHRVIAAIAPASEAEGNRLCKYLPVLRDRLQRFAARVRVVGSSGGQPTLRGDREFLANSLEKSLRLSKPPEVRVVDTRYPITEVLRTRPRQCAQGKLSS